MRSEVLKFDDFELDLGRYELRRRGRAVKLERVPMELLILLAEREGQLVTREEIIQRLWGNDVFVDTRQGINTAIRKIRLALQDDPERPRILETVIGKGYRFLATVTAVDPHSPDVEEGPVTQPPVNGVEAQEAQEEDATQMVRHEESASVSPPLAVRPALARALFLIIQMGYLVLYSATFIHMAGVRRLGLPSELPGVVLVSGLVGSAVRLYLITAVAFAYRGTGSLFRQVFPLILLLDVIWAASPLLLFCRWGEVTLLFVAALAFLPFSQRTLMRSAGETPQVASGR